MSVFKFLSSAVDDVIGKRIDDQAVGVFLSTLGPSSSENVFSIAGVELIVDKGVVSTIFLKRSGVRAAEFLPRGITFVSTREDARKKFGTPTRSGEASNGIIRNGAWDRWDGDERRVHVEYASDGGIQMVTIMTRASAPGAS